MEQILTTQFGVEDQEVGARLAREPNQSGSNPAKFDADLRLGQSPVSGGGLDRLGHFAAIAGGVDTDIGDGLVGIADPRTQHIASAKGFPGRRPRG
jgi:hypothetical protein